MSNITVTLTLDQANQFIRDYPNSEYLKPALDKVIEEELPFPIKVSGLEELKKYDRAGTVIMVPPYSLAGFNYPYVRQGKGWTSDCSRNCYTLKDIWTADREFLVLFCHPEKKSVTFEMPVEKARKLKSSCILAPLVAEWDLENRKKIGDFVQTLEEYKNLPENTVLSSCENYSMPFYVKNNRRFQCLDAQHSNWSAEGVASSYKRKILYIPGEI